jgi:hypothetical protein
MRLWDKVVMSLEGVLIALDSLRANKVRAALTISGVAVGVFVVVAMGATVHGVGTPGSTRAASSTARSVPSAATPASRWPSGAPCGSSPKSRTRWPGSSAGPTSSTATAS